MTSQFGKVLSLRTQIIYKRLKEEERNTVSWSRKTSPRDPTLPDSVDSGLLCEGDAI